jgi:hypothetical protein
VPDFWSLTSYPPAVEQSRTAFEKRLANILAAVRCRVFGDKDTGSPSNVDKALLSTKFDHGNLQYLLYL